MMTLTLPIRARRIFMVLAALALFLAVQSIVFQYLDEFSDGDSDTLLSTYAQLTNSNLESSIPTWYAASLLLFCSILLATIALAKRINRDKYTRHWIGLAIIFLYISLDEGAMIHEELTDPMREIFNVTNYLYFAWMIVGIPVALAVALIYSKFVLDLPARIRKLFILAAVSFIGGAVVIEAFSSNMWYLDDGGSLPYMIVGTIEEFFEMLGAITFIYALLLYISQIQLSINLNALTEPAAAAQPQPVIIPALSRQRTAIFTLLAGFTIGLLQWMLVRELYTLTSNTEWILPIVAASILLSLAVGSRLSAIIPRFVLLSLGIITLVLHLTLPLWFRAFAIALENIGGATLAWILPAIVSPVVLTGFLSIFLPHLTQGNFRQTAQRYAFLIPGAGAALALVQITQGIAAQSIFALYLVSAAVCLLVIRIPRRFTGLFVAGGIGWMLLYPRLDYATNTLLFRALQGLPPGTETLFSGYSRYQKVDILQSPQGARYLYLDGQSHFDSDTDSRLNTYLGAVPAMLIQPDTALVMQAGSMHMERLVAEHAGHVTTVDRDSVLIQASLEYFDDYNLMSNLDNRTVLIDDPEHYIVSASDQYDLMNIGTAMRGNMIEFYAAAADRLAPDGILVTDLTGNFGAADQTARQIAASLTSLFAEVIIVTPESAGSSIAYAAKKLPFTRDELSAALQLQGETQFTIFDSAVVRAVIGDEQSSGFQTN